MDFIERLYLMNIGFYVLFVRDKNGHQYDLWLS